MHVIIFILSLISIDVFFIIYKGIKILELKRIHLNEKNNGFKEDEYTKLEDIQKKWPIIIYGIMAIIGSFYINFINTDFLVDSFVTDFVFNIELNLLPVLICLSFSIIWKYIQNVILFFKGFKTGVMIDEENEEEEEE